MTQPNSWWTEVYDGQANERTAKRIALLSDVAVAARKMADIWDGRESMVTVFGDNTKLVALRAALAALDKEADNA